MSNLTRDAVARIVDDQLARLSDSALSTRIRELLVTPYRVDREWDYGDPGVNYACWTILEHRPSNTGIAYCEHGFGPGDPWGLVFLSGSDMSIGMDCAWYSTLEEAFRLIRALDHGATR